MEGNSIDALRQLALKIKKGIEEGISQGVLQSEEDIYFRWKVNEFEYSEKGVTKSSSSGEQNIKKTWWRATSKVVEDIKKSDEYSSALELFVRTFENEKRISFALERFVQILTSNFFINLKLSEKDINLFITTFLKDLKEEPLKYGTKVELDGLVISPERIEFKIGDKSIILRQTRAEDLEKEYPFNGFNTQPSENPSAILNIEFLGRQANEIQLKVEQAITILRLFKVGSVKYISYNMYSDSITDIMAFVALTSGHSQVALEKYLITKEDVPKLKEFWQTMIKTMPSSFYDLGETKLDYINISYNRYCDALLQNGILERRIANAVMGLESLLLKGGENQELIYRLSIRIAKIFSLLGYDPYKVKDVVKDAYKVRSLFVHGDQLSYNQKRKLNDKYGDIRSFLLLLLDYLRISIIIIMFVKKEKDELLDLIDDSLVDEDKGKQLNNLLNSAKNIILGR